MITNHTVVDQVLSPLGLAVVFEPVIRLEKNIRHIERLEIRLNGPRRPVAESSEALRSLFVKGGVAQHVARDVLCTLLQEASFIPEHVSLELSLSALVIEEDPELALFVMEGARAAGITPDRLVVSLHDQPLATRTRELGIAREIFRLAGARFALMDNNDPVATYRLLPKLKPDVLVLERPPALAEISHLRTPTSRLLRAARALNIEVVSRGIERADDAERAIAGNIVLQQGAWHAAPMLPEVLLAHPLFADARRPPVSDPLEDTGT